MQHHRYCELEDNPDAILTALEIAEGWHWCSDWDLLLVGPGMNIELKCCTCQYPPVLALKVACATASQEALPNKEEQKMFIIVREIYPPTILCIDPDNRWVLVGEGQRSDVTLFWDLNLANAVLAAYKGQWPDAKVVGIHALERLVTLKQIGDRWKKEKEHE
jgi:hypothetical protein